MTARRAIALALLSAGLVALATDRTRAEPPPGPPWPVNHGQLPQRSPEEAPTRSWAAADAGEDGGRLGASVMIRAAVAKPKLGNEYELRYQLRLHTRKGQLGPLLGNPSFPGGVAFTVRSVKCQYDWIEFYESADITRKDLTGMTNLPVFTEKVKFKVGIHSVLEESSYDENVAIRVEPQLYDVSEKKFLTTPQTPAAILVAAVGPDRKVWEVKSLSAWLVERGRGNKEGVEKALALLADLDEFDPTANRVEHAFHLVLADKEVSTETKLLFIRAVDARSLNWKPSYNLRRTLEAMAGGTDAELKAAAQKKLDEARN